MGPSVHLKLLHDQPATPTPRPHLLTSRIESEALLTVSDAVDDIQFGVHSLQGLADLLSLGVGVVYEGDRHLAPRLPMRRRPALTAKGCIHPQD